MIISSRRPVAGRNPYLDHRPGKLVFSWRAVAIRMLLVIVPGQLIGYLIGARLAVATGAFGAGPHLGLLVSVVAAVFTGAAVGIFVSPPARRRVRCAALSTAIGAAVSVLLIMLAVSRLSTAYLPAPAHFAPTVLLTAIGQGLICWTCWMIKPRR